MKFQIVSLHDQYVILESLDYRGKVVYADYGLLPLNPAIGQICQLSALAKWTLVDATTQEPFLPS